MIAVKIKRKEDGREWNDMSKLREPLLWALEKYNSELPIPEKENLFYSGVYKTMQTKLHFPDDIHGVYLRIEYGVVDRNNQSVYFFGYTNRNDEDDSWWIDPELFEIKETIL